MSLVGAASAQRSSLEIPSDSAHILTARLFAGGVARSLELDDEIADALRLALTEICSEAIERRRGGRIAIEIVGRRGSVARDRHRHWSSRRRRADRCGRRDVPTDVDRSAGTGCDVRRGAGSLRRHVHGVSGLTAHLEDVWRHPEWGTDPRCSSRPSEEESLCVRVRSQPQRRPASERKDPNPSLRRTPARRRCRLPRIRLRNRCRPHRCPIHPHLRIARRFPPSRRAPSSPGRRRHRFADRRDRRPPP